LALMMRLFTEPSERAKAMGVYGFVCGGGGAVGLLLGGVVTSMLGWRWILFINIPIGLVVYALSYALLPRGEKHASNGGFDVVGALILTTASTLAVYTVMTGSASGWWSWRTVTLTAVVAALLFILAVVETRVRAPLVPRHVLGRTLVLANIVGMLWSAAEFVWFFISTLYLQRVQGYTPQQVGWLFFPANLLTAVLSLGISAKLVMRFGICRPLFTGLLLVSAGLALFTQLPQSQGAALIVIPGMLLIGLGSGLALNPLFLAAMSGVGQSEAGLGSGVVNTSIMMGGALGLAVVASLAAARTSELQAAGVPLISSLNAAYHVAFLVGALFAAGALIPAVLLRAADQVACSTPCGAGVSE
jgi:predicted MFS family arabinose efflux permease